MKYSQLRSAGVLAHVSSLPSPYGSGGFGKDTFVFLDLIREAGFSYWQVLPLCPIGYGSSPYSSLSAFAGNELFIDPDMLREEGYLGNDDTMPFYVDRSRVNWEWVKTQKLPLLIKASKNFLKIVKTDPILEKKYKTFKNSSRYWLNDYALFRVFGDHFGTYSWNTSWPREFKSRNKNALKKFTNTHYEEIESWKIMQFFFFSQWDNIRKFALTKGIKIIGDMPYCSSKDSAEVWAHPELFYFNIKLKQTRSVGVPPDAFSKNGQLWGNPQYKWKAHRNENYKFWKARISSQLKLYDLLRIDHFRGFVSSWTVPSKEKTAINGRWIKSNGDELFDAIYKKFKFTKNNTPFIAEDLGVITDEVIKLRKKYNLPSLRVMQFAFNGENKNPHLPHMWGEDIIGYIGTHDNNTIVGWWQDNASAFEKESAKKYFYSNDESTPWYMIRSLLESRAPIVMLTLQDLSFLSSDARFNTPGTVSENNWTWRMTSIFDAMKFKELLYMFNRV